MPPSLRTKAFGWCALMLALIALASLLLGAGPVPASEALAVLSGAGSDEARFVVLELRLPSALRGWFRAWAADRDIATS